MSQELIICCGAPGSSKSTWAKEFISLNKNYIRINNDDMRSMLNNSVFSSKNEKMIKKLRTHLIEEYLSQDFSVIIDNVNANEAHWDEACKLAEKSNRDIIVKEKLFYQDLYVLIERDSKRIGSAKVGEMVVKKFWKQLGGKQFAHRQARIQTFSKKDAPSERSVPPMIQDQTLGDCAIFDLDGTMCNIDHRSPYDASKCNLDSPNLHVINLCKLFYNNKYKIFFFSGRENKFRDLTEKWLNANFGGNYELYMRETGNFEDDRKLKERLFSTHVKNKFNCKAWVDDRLRVAEFVYQAGLPLFRVGNPTASF